MTSYRNRLVVAALLLSMGINGALLNQVRSYRLQQQRAVQQVANNAWASLRNIAHYADRLRFVEPDRFEPSRAWLHASLNEAQAALVAYQVAAGVQVGLTPVLLGRYSILLSDLTPDQTEVLELLAEDLRWIADHFSDELFRRANQDELDAVRDQMRQQLRLPQVEDWIY